MPKPFSQAVTKVKVFRNLGAQSQVIIDAAIFIELYEKKVSCIESGTLLSREDILSHIEAMRGVYTLDIQEPNPAYYPWHTDGFLFVKDAGQIQAMNPPGSQVDIGDLIELLDCLSPPVKSGKKHSHR